MTGAVAREVIARDGVSRLALVAFNGGNIVLKLAGEWGAQAPPQFGPSPPVVRRSIWRFQRIRSTTPQSNLRKIFPVALPPAHDAEGATISRPL